MMSTRSGILGRAWGWWCRWGRVDVMEVENEGGHLGDGWMV